MDYYQILGVAKKATPEEIRKAYMALAKQWHPDRHKIEDQPKASEKFKEATSAYEVLYDAGKRAQYDAVGYVGRRPPPPPPKPKANPQPKPAPQEHSSGKKAAGPDPQWRDYTKTGSDAVDGVTYSYIERKGMGRTIQMQVRLTPSLKAGGMHKFKVKKRPMCQRCLEDGKVTVLCPACTGKRPEVGWCQKCDGMGGVRVECVNCKGEGLSPIYYVDEVTVKVPPNCPSGHMVQVIGAGESGGAGVRPPGNVQIVFI